MRLALALAALALLAPALAGCLGQPAEPPPPSPGTKPPAGNQGTAPSTPRAGGNGTAQPPAPPPPRRITFGGPSNEVSLAIDPKDPRRMIVGAKDYSLFFAPPCPRQHVWSGVYFTADGGRTWRHTVLPGFPGDTRASPLLGYLCATDPVVAFDGGGVAHYAGLAYGNTTTGQGPPPLPLPPPPVTPPEPPNATVPVQKPEPSLLFLAKSRDGGLTWDEVRVVAEDRAGLVFHDKPAMVLWPQGIAMAWSVRVGEVPVSVVSASTDGGANWTRPVPILPPGAVSTFGASLAFAGGKVHVALLGTDAAGASRLYAASSDDGAQTFAPAVEVAAVSPPPSPLPNSQFRVPTIPALAASPQGALLVAWNDGASGTSDVLVGTSPDGAAWSEPKPVHRDARGDQFMPAAAFTSTGEAVVLFYDRRADPANRLVQVAVARSLDGGASWNDTLLDQRAFDGDLSLHQSGAPYLGDYIGLATAGAQAWGAWTATPFGRADVFVARVSPR